MENDEQEIIIDSTNDEEAEEVIQEETPEEPQEQPQEEHVEEEKPQETPEAKRARLERQLKQHNKKFGFDHQETSKAKPQESPKGVGLSPKDILSFMNAKINEEDIDEVIEYANFKGISIQEALKSTVIKATLSEREEKRQTAEATNTGRGRGGAYRPSGDHLLSRAKQKGEVPDSKEALDALLEARYKSK